MKEKQGSQSVVCQAPKLQSALPFFLNGDVTTHQSRQIENHVPSCPECKRKMAFLIALSEHGSRSLQDRKPDMFQQGVDVVTMRRTQ